tara:strand:+ start:17 stop:205 length:189 start_codon:yes stop_codon:yes gene_type:complete
METTKRILRRYKRTDVRCRYLKDLSEVLSPAIELSLILFILGVRKKVFIKKLIDIPKATNAP